MIAFLRKIRKDLVNRGAVRRYLFYALGEVLLVMVGILLALQVNNWNNNRTSKIEEEKILKGMYETLNDDLSRFKVKMSKVYNAEKRIQTLQDLIQSGAKVDTLNILCGAAYGTHNFDLTTSPYEVLKSSGLNIIIDDTLRQLIVKIYDKHLNYIISCNSIELNVVMDGLRPYYLSNFTNIRFYETATPNDPEAIYQDKYYHNLIDYRLTVIRNNLTSYYPGVITDIENLLLVIKEYLDFE